MNNVNKTYCRKLFFSKWSRNGYAVFNSLHAIVHIARLIVDVCKLSLQKVAPTIISEIQAVLLGDELNNEYAEDVEQNNVFIIVPAIATNTDVYKTLEYKSINLIRALY